MYDRNSVRKNTRAEAVDVNGRLLVKFDFNQSFWFEHEGHRVSLQQAAKFLLADLFLLLVSDWYAQCSRFLRDLTSGPSPAVNCLSNRFRRL